MENKPKQPEIETERLQFEHQLRLEELRYKQQYQSKVFALAAAAISFALVLSAYTVSRLYYTAVPSAVTEKLAELESKNNRLIELLDTTRYSSREGQNELNLLRAQQGNLEARVKALETAVLGSKAGSEPPK